MSKKQDGSINIRISKETHKKLKKYADKRGNSLDRLISDSLNLAIMFGQWDIDPMKMTWVNGTATTYNLPSDKK